MGNNNFYSYPFNKEEEKKMLLLFGNNGQFDLKPYQEELFIKLLSQKER